MRQFCKNYACQFCIEAGIIPIKKYYAVKLETMEVIAKANNADSLPSMPYIWTGKAESNKDAIAKAKAFSQDK